MSGEMFNHGKHLSNITPEIFKLKIKVKCDIVIIYSTMKLN
jgi:hypothetical protein